MNLHPSTLVSTLLALTVCGGAEDLTLKPQPFTVNSEFDCVAVPAKFQEVVVESDEWSDFTIEMILDHGSAVKKGDTLVQFRSKALERQLEDRRRAVKKAELALADARSGLAAQEAELPLTLAAVRASDERAAADLELFRKTNRPAQEERARKDLESSQFRLKSENEELKQLLEMYEADELTDQTEEFILERQKKAVAMAEFGLRMQQLKTKQTLEVSLPRQDEDLERAAKHAKIARERAEAELPRALEAARIDAATSEAAHQRAAADMARLEADAAMLELKAEAGGWFYHGAFRDGAWRTGDLVKGLVTGGKVGIHRAFAAVVPGDAALQFVARVEQGKVRGLADDATGQIRISGYDEQAAEAKVESVAPVPGTDGRYLVALSATLADGLAASPGTKAKARVEVHSNPQAIVVPKAAIKDGEGGSRQVEVRLADSESEMREVVVGRSSGDEVEILSGLEAGQAIVVPEKE